MSTAEYARVIANRRAAEARYDGAARTCTDERMCVNCFADCGACLGPVSAAPSSLSAEPDVFFPCVDDKDNDRLNRIEELMKTTFDGKEVPQVWLKRADVYRIVAAALTTPAQAPAIQAPEAVAVVEAIGNGKVEAMLLKNLPEGTLLFATPSASVSAGAPAARAGWDACARMVFSLTDQTGDEASARKPDDFMRGRAFEAKSIAKAIRGLSPEHCEEMAAYFATPAPAPTQPK